MPWITGLLSAITKLFALIAPYFAGKKAARGEAAQDALDDAQEARKIEDDNAVLDAAERRRRLFKRK